MKHNKLIHKPRKSFPVNQVVSYQCKEPFYTMDKSSLLEIKPVSSLRILGNIAFGKKQNY